LLNKNKLQLEIILLGDSKKGGTLRGGKQNHFIRQRDYSFIGGWSDCQRGT